MGVNVNTLEMFESMLVNHLRAIAELHEQVKGHDRGLDNIMEEHAENMATSITRIESLVRRAKDQDRTAMEILAELSDREARLQVARSMRRGIPTGVIGG